VVGRRAQLVDAATGAPLGEVAADQGFVPQLALTSLRGTDVVVDVERGAVVARLPRAAMLPLWAVAVDDAIVAIAVAGDRITVELAGGELYFVDVATGDAVAAAGWARRWRLLGAGDRVAVEDVLPGGADAPDRWRIATWGVDGVPRFAVALALEPPWLLGPRGGAPGAPVVAAYGPAGRAAAVLDPDTGAVRARVTLPDRTVPGAVFATMVDGAPVAGAVLRQPLGVVLF
ncbi:MAG: hypothetical protein H6709_25170, partial [Kofleriaceae bacterium]|nr:hypothetical protein [Kofleriaceae bacterium]MCB9575381.1 hypothetical protein [Kofleriaceae bacterium]